MKTLKTWAAAAATLVLASAAYAAPVFQGRLADGTASATCTVSGTDKCAMFYNTTLDITILNDWNIGNAADFGSAPALAAAAGAAQTEFTGWAVATGNGEEAAGPRNQFLSIWNDVGRSSEGLQAQFDGVQDNLYWAGSGLEGFSGFAWLFIISNGAQLESRFFDVRDRPFVAVRPGDVSASVPEPQTLALTLMALGAVLVARRRRAR